MKDRPPMNLIGMDGNIFYILGMASRILQRNGLKDEAEEMFARVKASGDYYKALGIISEYVQTEMSKPDPGILERGDIEIDPELICAPDGITAYVETWFDTERRFGVPLEPDDSIDLYATYHPDTDAFSASIIVKKGDAPTSEPREIRLLPSERKLIREKMEECATQEHTSLKEMYAEWKNEYGCTQTHSKQKEKKNQHER